MNRTAASPLMTTTGEYSRLRRAWPAPPWAKRVEKVRCDQPHLGRNDVACRLTARVQKSRDGHRHACRH